MNYPYWQGQKIQNLSSVIQNDVQVFYVNNPQDMERINPMPNVVYIGLNTSTKEVYIRQLNGIGLIDFDVYVRQSGEQQKNDLTKILDKLDEIMKGKGNVIQSANGSIGNEYVSEGNVEKPSASAEV